MGEDKTLPLWAIPLAIVPALLIFILVFLEGLMTGWVYTVLPHDGSYTHFYSQFPGQLLQQ